MMPLHDLICDFFDLIWFDYLATIRESIVLFSDSIDGTSAKDVMDLLILTQYFDTLHDIGRNPNTKSIYLSSEEGNTRNAMMEAGACNHSRGRKLIWWFFRRTNSYQYMLIAFRGGMSRFCSVLKGLTHFCEQSRTHSFYILLRSRWFHVNKRDVQFIHPRLLLWFPLLQH